MTPEAWRAAFQRFVDALNRSRDAAAAFTDDARVDRHQPGDGAPLAETYAGLAAVARWVALTPAAVQFALAGEPVLDGDHATIAYALHAGEFHNGGTWRARLAADGRIAYLSHHPRALP